MKVCGKCNCKLPLIEFTKDASRRDGLHHFCKECKRKQARERHLATKTVVNERCRTRAAEATILINELKSNGCVICGEDFVGVFRISPYGSHKERFCYFSAAKYES